MGMFEDVIGSGVLGGLFQGQNARVSQWPGYPGTGQSQAMYSPQGAGGNVGIAGNPTLDTSFWSELEAAFEGGLGESIDWAAQLIDRRNQQPMTAIDHARVPGGSPLIGPGQHGLGQLIQQLGGYR